MRAGPPKEVSESTLALINICMERLGNCIVMLENNIKVFDVITAFYTEQLGNEALAVTTATLLQSCQNDISGLKNHIKEIREVTQAVADRAKLLKEIALRREAAVSFMCFPLGLI